MNEDHVESDGDAHASVAVPVRRRFGAAWECAGPWITGLVAGLLVAWMNPSTLRTAQSVERLLSGSIDAAAVLAGFQVTALTLLLSIADKPIIRRLRDSGFYAPLIAYHWQAIVALLLWLVLSLALLTVQGGTLEATGRVADLGAFTRWSAVALVVVMVSAICASFRVMKLLVKLLRVTAIS